MSYKFFNVVDVQSRQYPFDILNGIKIKTDKEEFEITLDNLNQDKIFDLINNKINFQVIGKTACLSVNSQNIFGILYTEH